MKKLLLVVVVLLLALGLVNAISQEELNEARGLVDSKITCDKLTDGQLEKIGEYYMEQMMPGEAHKRAHEMMGLVEGSDAEEAFHMDLARRSYCGENAGGYGMMRKAGSLRSGYGMMGFYPGSYNSGYGDFFNIWGIIAGLFWIGIIIFLVWLAYRVMVKKEIISGNPLEILKSRYAKGEISKKEFEDIKKEIVGDGHGKRK